MAGDDPMLNFDERDLYQAARTAGFRHINLDFMVEFNAEETRDEKDDDEWLRFTETWPNPKLPSLVKIMEEALSLAEIEAFTDYLKPLVESQKPARIAAHAYLSAVK